MYILLYEQSLLNLTSYYFTFQVTQGQLNSNNHFWREIIFFFILESKNLFHSFCLLIELLTSIVQSNKNIYRPWPNMTFTLHVQIDQFQSAFHDIVIYCLMGSILFHVHFCTQGVFQQIFIYFSFTLLFSQKSIYLEYVSNHVITFM